MTNPEPSSAPKVHGEEEDGIFPPMQLWMLVEIRWKDSHSSSSWEWTSDFDWEEDEEGMHHRTVGYLVHDGKEQIVLAMCRGEEIEKNGETLIGHVFRIPKCCISSVRPLL